MSIKQLSSDQIANLVGTRHPATGFEYPPDGLQPYYQWLVRTLHLLAESGAGALRVTRDEAGPTKVHVAPGRASIADVPLAYPGGTIDLASYNNDTALLWLADDDGEAAITVVNESTGWPGASHIKLAEVTLEAGEIVDVLDRRFETILRV